MASNTSKSSKSGFVQLPNGRPDQQQLMRRKDIVRLTLDELHARLMDPKRIREIETRDLVSVAKTLDDDLRVNKQEHTVREPLTVKIITDGGGL